ncbi:AbfB domain-containing protein [Virgisporangium aurantiacum]|uniref:Alpha-L-arabinofuranosidase B arabinose-binding domain-containing protein n=1 Tax=Virgisporangium aurantiacum TaxID=175570 RepID=A0A8J3Z486_9ACTN|nr:AbfB domain-containing protein [Virgisporangium aurantiacum]GIJ57304.1 hypothetical protein Vau01_048200 [Virgisporangium aurantiacum]
MSNLTTWTVSIKATNVDGYLRHRNFLGELDPIANRAGQDARDASFVLVPGLADDRLFSIRARYDFADHYLRHQEYRLKLQEYQLGDEQFAKDATFALVPSLASPPPGGPYGVSFRPYEFSKHYIRHRDHHLWIDEYRDESLYRADASFVLTDSIFEAIR